MSTSHTIDALEPRLLLAVNSIRLFAPGVPIPASAVLRAAAVGDFNGDGAADLAAVVGTSRTQTGGSQSIPFDGGVQILLNDGAGRFTPGPVRPLRAAPDGIAVGDFNGDGDLDVATNYGTVTILYGDGNGGLEAGVEHAANERPSGILSPGSIVAGDFNGDGRTDVAAAGFRTISTNPKTGVSTSESQISVLFGGAGGMSAPVRTFIAGGYHLGLAAVRYDTDARTDLAVTGGTIQLLASKGDGTFDFPATLGGGGVATVARDLNNDGRPDLLWQKGGDARLHYALANPALGFGPVRTLDPGTPAPQVGVGGFGAGDFNGDGLLDLIVSPDASTGRGTLFQRSGGTFRPVIDASGIVPTATADFNGDGLDDAVAGDRVYLANPPSVYARAGGTLVITGTRRADRLSVGVDGSRLVTTLNGVTYSSRVSKIRRIQIATGTGNDAITIDPAVFSPCLISAGGDDDTVRAGGGADTVQGDAGHDLLDGGAGADLVQGGRGDDVLTGGTGPDAIYGNRGSDLFATSDHADELLDRNVGEGFLNS